MVKIFSVMNSGKIKYPKIAFSAALPYAEFYLLSLDNN